ncbi:hypothetical protein WDW37_17600, partial [Bdellovibrionota bacterium FG-1]
MHNFCGSDIDRVRNAGRTDLIIGAALATLGMTPRSLFDLMGLPPEATLEVLKAERLSAFEWFAICEALYM